jgi:hypothetical protein
MSAKKTKKKKKKSKKETRPASTSQRRREILLKRVEQAHSIPREKVKRFPPETGKMSQVMLDFAQPLLDKCEDTDSMKGAISMAIAVWNMSFLSPEKQDEMLEQLIGDRKAFSDARDLAEVVATMDTLIERKKKYFADKKRVIVDFQMYVTPDERLHLDVVSTVTS